MLTVPAPAKLNLTLEVLARRPDGYHEIRSVFQTISLGDTLHFQPGREIIFKSSLPGWTPEKSLIARAASLLKETSGCPQGVTIEVDNRIPLVSGLGGDSSDAAATLRGLNKLWELGLSREKLLELAAKLGSDVPFFLYGGTKHRKVGLIFGNPFAGKLTTFNFSQNLLHLLTSLFSNYTLTPG